VKITRREFLESVGALALVGGAMASVGELAWAAPAGPQTAGPQTVSIEELMAPGPLPDHVLGAAEAPVTIIEYASMTCPHCANFHETTYPELKKRYIDTGKVRFIFREFPLDPLAAAGFMLARCAGEGKYYPMIETLFHQQKTWAVQKPIPPLLAIAKQAGFSQQSFEQCLANQKLLDDIEKVRERASSKFGVNSTPTFFINGERVAGAVSIDDLEKKIQPYLKS
jgi:protein-disulfide isomerase